MSRAQAEAAIGIGAALADELARDGVGLIGIGDMGIGNTTASTALAALFSGAPPEEVAGRGTGIDDDGLRRKIDAVRRGLEVNRPDARDGVDALAKVGGFEIAGLAGVVLGAAAARVPVVIDGFIASVAALAAVRIAPAAAGYLVASHRSVEVGHRLVLQALGNEAAARSRPAPRRRDGRRAGDDARRRRAANPGRDGDVRRRRGERLGRLTAGPVDPGARKAMIGPPSAGPMASESENSFAKGQRIDRYEIREPVGQGGMGAVYRAFDTKLGRTVALKTVVAHRRAAHERGAAPALHARGAGGVEGRPPQRRAGAGLRLHRRRHPSSSWSTCAARTSARGSSRAQEPLAVEYVADVMLGVCAALRACHHVGIIHRDLKPANIFLCDTDTGWEVKVLDFGVSKAPLADDLTEEGQILGTPQYLSPEQIEGKTVPESDQYALGVLIYVCLTKRLPYEEHQSLSLLRAIELGKFDPPRAHRPELPAGSRRSSCGR